MQTADIINEIEFLVANEARTDEHEEALWAVIEISAANRRGALAGARLQAELTEQPELFA